ncbi:MAG: transglutaminase domain-containing protein [Terriglobia bacterium]
MQSRHTTAARGFAVPAAIVALAAALYLGGLAVPADWAPQAAVSVPSAPVPAASLPALEAVVEAVVQVRPAPLTITELWVPLPSPDESQSVDFSRLEVRLQGGSAPWEVTRDEYGNRFIHLRGAAEAPLALRYTVPVRRHSNGYHDRAALAAAIDTAARANGAASVEYPYGGHAEEALGSLTTSDRLVEQVLDGLLAAVNDLPEPLQQAVMLNEVLRRNGRYLKTGAYGAGSPLWFCLTGQGNCTDFHFTYLEVAARVALPGRFRIGIPLSPEPDQPVADAGEVPGYHCWIYLGAPLELAIDPSWEARLNAPTGTYLGRPLNDRLKLTEGTALRLAPAISGAPLPFLFQAYAEADGEPLPRAYAAAAGPAPSSPGVVTTYHFQRVR